MNPDSTNEADRCLSDAAKKAERKRLEEQTYDKLDVIACERTRMIAEALIDQLTNEDDGKRADGRNAERINKLRDSSKLFEPLRERRETTKSNRQTAGEPAKKLLRELLEHANAQLRAEESANDSHGTESGGDSQSSCDTDSGCQAKLTSQQIQTIVLQSSTTAVDLEAQKATSSTESGTQSGEANEADCSTAEAAPEENDTDTAGTATQLAKTVHLSKATKAGSHKANAAPTTPNKNILSLISQSEVLVNDAVRKAQGTLKKLRAE
jgi:hypothetical protein